jgi:hypothetical protein
MLYLIPAFLKDPIRARISDRTDLEDAWRLPASVNGFTVPDFFHQRERRDADLLDTVRSVCIKIGKSQDPSVIHLHLMRRPGIKGQIFNLLDFIFHIKGSLSESCPGGSL